MLFHPKGFNLITPQSGMEKETSKFHKNPQLLLKKEILHK